jgi:G3E family GTPase
MTSPVHIVTGFLGAGKTTLMNRYLKSPPPGLQVAIIINDFGTVAVDAELVDRSNYAMKELPSGCVCCTLSGALTNSLADLAREQQPDVVVMETTGLARPAQIAELFQRDVLRKIVHIGNVVCVVDSSTFAKYESHFPVMSEQVSQSNTLVLNKTAMADPAMLDTARERAQFLSQPAALLIETNYCDLGPGLLFDERPTYFPATQDVVHEHIDTFHSCTIEEDGAYSLPRIESFMADPGEGIVRAKGIVRTDAGPKLIQWTLTGLEISDWNKEPQTSRLVFIGRALDSRSLTAILRQCLV